jgi:hypothetical protein
MKNDKSPHATGRLILAAEPHSARSLDLIRVRNCPKDICVG